MPSNGLTDAQLLTRFVAERDEGAFAALVDRHGPLVLGVCRRVLRDHHDAEDAFQATFLALARKAPSLRRREAVAGWLYEVAYCAAVEAGRARARRGRERQVGDMPHPEVQPTEPPDWRPVLDRELAGLPQKYRSAIVLCDLEGLSRREAARQLGLAEGTLSSRLATGRRVLAGRLTRRGVAFSGGALAAALSEAAASARVPAALVWSTAKAAAGGLAASTPAAALMEGVVKAMLMAKLKVVLGVALVVGAVGAGGLGYRAGAARAAPSAGPRSELEELHVGSFLDFSPKPQPPVIKTGTVQERLLTLQLEEKRLLLRYGPNNRAVRDVQEEMKRLRAMIPPSRKTKVSEVTRALVRLKVRLLRKELEQAESAVRSLGKLLKEGKEEAKAAARFAVQDQSYQQEIQRLKTLADSFAKRVQRQAEIQALIGAIEDALKNNRSEAEVLALISGVPVDKPLLPATVQGRLVQERLLTLQLEEKRLLLRYGPNHRAVRDVQEEMKRLHAMIAPSRKTKLSEGTHALARMRIRLLEKELEQAEGAEEPLGKLLKEGKEEAKAAARFAVVERVQELRERQAEIQALIKATEDALKNNRSEAEVLALIWGEPVDKPLLPAAGDGGEGGARSTVQERLLTSDFRVT
jgi:RNA polymerase sigma factor (sigma-70 family)